MRVGGVSNSSLRARINANVEDRKAWKINGLKPRWYTLSAMRDLGTKFYTDQHEALEDLRKQRDELVKQFKVDKIEGRKRKIHVYPETMLLVKHIHKVKCQEDGSFLYFVSYKNQQQAPEWYVPGDLPPILLEKFCNVLKLDFEFEQRLP